MAFLPRYTLRTILLAVAISAALAAWPASRWRKWRRDQAVVQRLEAKDGQVTVFRQPGSTPWERAYRITFDEYVRLGPTSGSPDEPRPTNLRLTVDDIRALASLEGLEELALYGDVLEPAAYAVLAELKQLKALRVSNGMWDDERLRHLESLAGLEELTLEQTRATDEGVERLQKKLPKLAIADD